MANYNMHTTPDANGDVEMVALNTEQSKPLINREVDQEISVASTGIRDDIMCTDNTTTTTTVTGTDSSLVATGATAFVESSPATPTPTSPLSPMPTSPTHEFLKSGTIPKNRKRPGSTSDSQRVTMTGTVMGGSSVGQPVEVQLDLSETEYLRLTEPRSPRSPCAPRSRFGLNTGQGPHIFLLSLLAMPVALAISACCTFYHACLTWNNLILHYSQDKAGVLPRVTLCPLIILSFPLTVGLTSMLVSLAAIFMQLSWSFAGWRAELWDGEKGVCGWLCARLGLPHCAPYQVVLLEQPLG